MSSSSESLASLPSSNARGIALAGWVLIVLFLTILSASLLPVRLFDAAWQLRVGGVLINSAPFPLIGLADADEPGAAPGWNLGLQVGQCSVPDDFDQIASEEIADLFGGCSACKASSGWAVKLLLDAHIFSKAMGEPDHLAPAWRDLLEDLRHCLCSSVASLWELVIKVAVGREGFQVPPSLLRRTLLNGGFVEIPLEAAHGLSVAQLPPLLRDLFDGLLRVQAEGEGL